MDSNCRLVIVLVMVGLFVGCASQRPVLYPNDLLKKVGETVAEQDVEDCIELSSIAGLETKQGKKIAGKTVVGAASGAAVGAASGAVVGHAGRGAATGAASAGTGGFMWGLFQAKELDPVQKRFIEECLHGKGYKVIGWK